MTVWAPTVVLPLESAWSVLNKLAWFNETSVRQFLLERYAPDPAPPARGQRRKAAITAAPPAWLRAPQAVSDSPEAVVDGQSLSADLARRIVPPGGISQDAWLRTCPTCMAMGYHSALHQAPDYAVCAFHDVPLRQGCPICRAPMLYWSLLDEGVQPYGCARCGGTATDDWSPLPRTYAGRHLRDQASSALGWLGHLSGIELAGHEGACIDEWRPGRGETRPLNHARLHACSAVHARPDNLAAPVNRFSSIRYDMYRGARRAIGRYHDRQNARRVAATTLRFQEAFDQVDLGVVANIRQYHRCALYPKSMVEVSRPPYQFHVPRRACPFGAALEIWRLMNAEFLLAVAVEERWFLGFDERRSAFISRLTWEWCGLAARLCAAFQADERGMGGYLIDVAPWWDRGDWCGPFVTMAADTSARVTLFPRADCAAWARTVPCRLSGRF